MLLRTRNRLRFSRDGYKEKVTPKEEIFEWKNSLDLVARDLVNQLEEKFQFAPFQEKLELQSYQKNLGTLWLLDEMLGETNIPWESISQELLQLLDAGTQDFVRAPAIQYFFKSHNTSSSLTGIELDAFPVLNNLHSRADKASYYSSLLPNTKYLAGDFFHWREQTDFLFCFFPFVSPHPALAWGLPMEFGDAAKWVQGILQVVKPERFALVVHQGSWEEQEFDAAMPYGAFRLQLLERKELICPFYPMPYPAHASLYQLVMT